MLIFLALPLLLAVKALVAGWIFGYLWVGAVAAALCVFVFIRLLRFFSKTREHYLRLIRGDRLLVCGVIEKGEEIPLWEVDLADLGGVSVVKKPVEGQELSTLVGLVATRDGGQLFVDLLPFTQEYRGVLRKLEEQFHLAGVAPLDPELTRGVPIEAAPWYVPDG